MVSEVKLNNIGAYYVKDNNADPKNKSASSDASTQSVSVANNLNELIKSVNTYEDPIQSSALNDIKYRIQHNEYTVDFDKLSEKLLNSGIITAIGD